MQQKNINKMFYALKRRSECTHCFDLPTAVHRPYVYIFMGKFFPEFYQQSILRITAKVRVCGILQQQKWGAALQVQPCIVLARRLLRFKLTVCWHPCVSFTVVFCINLNLNSWHDSAHNNARGTACCRICLIWNSKLFAFTAHSTFTFDLKCRNCMSGGILRIRIELLQPKGSGMGRWLYWRYLTRQFLRPLAPVTGNWSDTIVRNTTIRDVPWGVWKPLCAKCGIEIPLLG